MNAKIVDAAQCIGILIGTELDNRTVYVSKNSIVVVTTSVKNEDHDNILSTTTGRVVDFLMTGNDDIDEDAMMLDISSLFVAGFTTINISNIYDIVVIADNALDVLNLINHIDLPVPDTSDFDKKYDILTKGEDVCFQNIAGDLAPASYFPDSFDNNHLRTSASHDPQKTGISPDECTEGHDICSGLCQGCEVCGENHNK